jgi:hypothetical protein
VVVTLPSGELVTHPKELKIIFKPQRKDNRMKNLMMTYGKNLVKGTWKK